MSVLINPPLYGSLLTTNTPNHKLNTDTTNYASLIQGSRAKTRYLDNEQFYMFDYKNMKIHWAFRSFDAQCEIRYNMFVFSDKGVWVNDNTHDVINNNIQMRHFEYFTQLTAVDSPKLIVTNKPNTKEIIWFIPKSYVKIDNEIIITDTNNNTHTMTYNETLLNSLKSESRYVEVESICYIPIYNFTMWIMVFQ